MPPALVFWSFAIIVATALVAFTIVAVLSLTGAQPADRPAILRALAEVLRALRGQRR